MSKPRVYKFEGKKGVTVDGHTMLIDDVVRDLNKLVAFEGARNELVLKIKELEAWKSDVMHVINGSSGVAGYHLNGEIATWGELGLEGES